jgi:hypothetical protein
MAENRKKMKKIVEKLWNDLNVTNNNRGIIWVWREK